MDKKKLNILLIEDDERIERIIRLWLSKVKATEFDLTWCDQLASGLERLKQGNIDVTLLDLNLPDSKGLDTVTSVSEVDPRMPIVVLTGTDSNKTGVMAVQRGAQDYLVKGKVNNHMVMRSIVYAIERKRIEMELHNTKDQLQKSYESISEATKKLIAPEVLNQLANSSSDGHLRAEQLTTTILFADIRGFTSISEQFEAELVVNLLNHLLGEMVVSIFEEGGYLDKFLGDGLMALFGAPVKIDAPELCAARAAFKMQARVDIFNYQRFKMFPELSGLEDDIKIGIGIHSGIATVGFIGTSDRCEYTAIGDCVNVASRLASRAGGGEVLVTRGIEAACRDEGAFENWEQMQLKGKAQTTEVGLLKYVKL